MENGYALAYSLSLFSAPNMLVFASGMLFSLAVYAFCIYLRERQSLHLLSALLNLSLALGLSGNVKTEASLSNTPVLFANGVFILAALALALQLQSRFFLSASLRRSIARTLRFISWMIAALLLASLLSTGSPQLILALAAFLSAAMVLVSLHTLRARQPGSDFFACAWMAVFVALVLAVVSPTNSSGFALALVLVCIFAMAIGLAIASRSQRHTHMYRLNYEKMEATKRRNNQRMRVYNDTIRHYFHNLTSMDEQTVSMRLLVTLTNLLPVSSCAMATNKDGAVSIHSLCLQHQTGFDDVLTTCKPLIEEHVRSGQTLSFHHKAEGEVITFHMIPVFAGNAANWKVVILRQASEEPLDADELQLAQDISSHACTMILACQKYSRLQNEADSDSLTGLLNQRAFKRRARTLVERLQLSQQEASILYMDIDHFKQLNDNHGHPFGDHVLTQFAEICQDNLRERDLLGRIGGEEFVVMLPLASFSAAKTIAERIRNSLQNHRFNSQGAVNVTVSIGITTTTKAGYNLDNLLCEADRALYKAKREGRNCTQPASLVAAGS